MRPLHERLARVEGARGTSLACLARLARPAVLVAHLAFCALALCPQPQAAAAPPQGSGLSAGRIERVVRRFDFEEEKSTLLGFPAEFKRSIAPDRGFPPFGAMALTDAASASGRWSFTMSLDGGSMAAGIPTGVVTVLPWADYVVTAKVRTVGLHHARARIAAWLHDVDGAPIAESRVQSALLDTAGEWADVELIVRGANESAADLVFELELVQPRHFHGAKHGAMAPGAANAALLEEDVRGSAWFDDIVIRHQPRIELRTEAPYNIIVSPERPRLQVLVRDLASEPLEARLVVTDLEGAVLHDSTFAAPRSRVPLANTLDIDRLGWFRATLEVLEQGRLAGARTLDFVVVPPARTHDTRVGACNLGVTISGVPTAHLADVAPLVDRLDVDQVRFAVWDVDVPDEERAERASAIHGAIEAILESGCDATILLERVPAALARTLNVDRHQVLEALSADPAAWRPFLDAILLDFSLRVARWQLGSTSAPTSLARPDLDALLAGAGRGLKELLPAPRLLVPASADPSLASLRGGFEPVVVIGSGIRPDAIPALAAEWPGPYSIVLQPLPRTAGAERERIVDLLQRALHAWRSGLEHEAIDAPWTWAHEPEGEVLVPDPAFAAWRGLAAALRGRGFAREIDLGPGVNAWLMADRGAGSDALALWREAPGPANQAVALLLADGPVEVTDPFGNTRVVDVDASGTAHRIDVSDMPVFASGIDRALVEFRAGLAFAPASIRPEHRVHEAEIVLHNPWSAGLTGTIVIEKSAQIDVSPQRHDFMLAPGETMRRPVSIVLDRGVLAGPRRVDVAVHLGAPRECRFRTEIPIAVGWTDVEVTATLHVVEASVAGGDADLVVTQHVSNRGTVPVNVDAFVIAPGYGRRTRPIASLAPGATISKTFRFESGATRLAGRMLHHGVTERDGLAQLNLLLEVPE